MQGDVSLDVRRALDVVTEGLEDQLYCPWIYLASY